MIPELPEGISFGNKIDFYSNLISRLEDQGTVHTRWWTHRQNPSVCWICDLIAYNGKVMDMLHEMNLTKSAVDMETSSSSEDDSESEIELLSDITESDSPEPELVNYNVDEEKVYNEPEYDVKEDELQS